jgi:hypothetical protein
MPIITLARRRALGHKLWTTQTSIGALSDPFRLQPVSRLVSLTPVAGRWFPLSTCHLLDARGLCQPAARDFFGRRAAGLKVSYKILKMM